MKRLQLFLKQKHKSKGQSLMEMTIAVGVLMLLAMGAVEFGYLMNQYINLVDGSREGARYASNQDPYAITLEDDSVVYDYSAPQDKFFENIYLVVDGNSSITDDTTERGAIAPVILNSATDEVMVYFLSIRENKNFEVSEVRCQFGCKSAVHPESQALVNVNRDFFTESLDEAADKTGMVVVEIFYAYKQLLSLPLFTAFIPDPIQVHSYSVMPLSSAEPTPVVGP